MKDVSKAILKICLHYPEMPVPSRGHASDAGIDLTAMAYEAKADHVFFIDTGVSVQVSQGYYLEVVPRSSIVKKDFIMANSVGIIDPDYRGRIFVPLRYLGEGSAEEACRRLLEQRIAQMIVRRLEPCDIEIVDELDQTVRGEGGFGSTG